MCDAKVGMGCMSNVSAMFSVSGEAMVYTMMEELKFVEELV